MRNLAKIVGVGWIAVFVAIGIWLGIREMLGAPGILFEGGYGEVYVLMLLAAPGYLLYRWGVATTSR